MKKKYKIQVGLILFLLAFCLTGCRKTGEPSENPQSDYEEHLDISLSYWLIDDAFSDAANDEVLKAIENKFNVTFTPVNVTWDDYYEKVLQWADSGTLPDIFVGAYRTDENYLKLINAGLLHEIPTNPSDYPNLSRYLDSVETDTCIVNDKLYCIFRQTYSEQAETIKDRTILYRWDLAKAAGIEKEPSNWQEFRQMIQAIIKADTEKKNITGLTAKGYTMIEGLLLNYSVPMGSTGGSQFYWVKEDSGYVPALFAGDTLGENAILSWKLARDMYNEGTIEPGILLTTTNQAEEKFLNGKSAAICIDGGISNTKLYENIGRYWKEVHGTEFWDDVKYLGMMPDVNGNLSYPVWDYAWSETYINSAVSDEKFERILAIYDYLLSEEGTLLTNFGIKDKTYTIATDGSVRLIDGITPSEVYPSLKAISYLVCWNYGNMNTYRYPNVVPEEYVLYDEERVDAARKVSTPPYNYECTKAFYNMGLEFNIDINEVFATMLVGEEPVEKMWADIIEEYKEKGLLDIIKSVNDTIGDGN